MEKTDTYSYFLFFLLNWITQSFQLTFPFFKSGSMAAIPFENRQDFIPTTMKARHLISFFNGSWKSDITAWLQCPGQTSISVQPGSDPNACMLIPKPTKFSLTLLIALFQACSAPWKGFSFTQRSYQVPEELVVVSKGNSDMQAHCKLLSPLAKGFH